MRNENEVVLKIGSSNPFTHSKTTQSFSVKVPGKGPSTVSQLMPDWSIATYDIVKEIKEYAIAEPMRFNLSRRQPQIRIYKGDIPESVLEEVISLLKKFKPMYNLNDPSQYDRLTGQPIGSKANESYWFEDMRQTKVKKVGTKKETHAIGNTIESELSGDDRKLRDALYIIGQEPTSNMDTVDLEDLLWDKVTEEGSEERKIFLDIYVNKESNKKYVEAMKYFRKGVSLGVIEHRAGVYMLGQDRLGMDDKECIAYLKEKEKVFQFLVNQIASKSSFDEDQSKGEEVKKTVTGSSDKEKAEKKMFDYLKGAFKESFGAKRPDLMIKDMSLSEAVERYAEECEKVGVENVIPDVDTLAKLASK